MKNTQINVTMPLDILLDFGFSEEKTARRMLELFVIDLYRRNHISSGKGAELLGIQKYDFIQLLASENVSYFDYTMTELDEELKVINQWESKNA